MEERVVSATEARIHFGELMQRVVQHQEIVIVERAKEPQVVMLSLTEYQRLKASQRRETWREAMDAAARVRAEIATRLGDQQLPPPEEILRQVRQERDEQLLGLR